MVITDDHTRTREFRPILPPASCWKVDLALSLVTYGEQICRVTMAAWAWLRVEGAILLTSLGSRGHGAQGWSLTTWLIRTAGNSELMRPSLLL